MCPPSVDLALVGDEDAVLTPLARASQRQGMPSLAERLVALRAWLGDDLGALEHQIVSLEATDHAAPDHASHWAESGTARAARHLVSLPGKRIRPLCVLVAARMGGRAMDREVRDTAVACELVHAATLLHDDVIDDGDERRGAAAARVLFGNSASVLGGDHLLVEALRLVHQGAHPSLMSELLRIMSRMVSAEALQLERRGRLVADRQGYLEVIQGKTAALFGWGLYAGGILGGLDASQCDHLKTIGHHLGMAFQLVDDVLDLEGESANTGKEALRDVLEGKMTWPLLLTMERQPSFVGALSEVLATPFKARDIAVRKLVNDVRAAGALEDTALFAQREAEAARDLLVHLPPGRARDALGWVVASAVHRTR